ncbi:MAG: hypothetical protein KDD41_01875 [Flavobacteriales bacterium]|nr:hypothetical protein [Flavobacteriales bacterium]
MKKIVLLIIISTGVFMTSCSKKSCKECSGCKTLQSATLCEDDFEKASDYNDQVDNYVSDGCTCSEK